MALIFGSSRASIEIVIELKTLGGLLSVWEIPTVCNGIPVTERKADATDPCTAASAVALRLIPGKAVPQGGIDERPCCVKPRNGCKEADTARETSVAIWPMMLGGRAETSGSAPGGLLPAVRVPVGRVPAVRVPTGRA